MGAFKFLSNNITVGQVSPLFKRRSDFSKYKNGVAKLQNMTILPQGGVTSRPGTKYITEVADSSKKVRLVPFEFSTTQAYVIEVGEDYMRFYKDSGQILESDLTITNITQANPGVVTSTAHGLSNGDQVFITEVVGMTEVNGLRYTVANKTANTFELSGVDTTSYTAYSSAGVANKVYEITSPYQEADLEGLQYSQSADVITFVHPSYAPRNLTRTSDTAWTLSTVTTEDGPYLPVNTTSTTITPDATSGTITWTASSTTGINGGDGFSSDDVGRYFRYYDVGPTKTITDITKADEATITASNHNLEDGDRVFITDVLGMTEINNEDEAYTVDRLTASAFKIKDNNDDYVNSSAFTAYTSGGISQKESPNWRWVKITAYTSSTVVDGTLQDMPTIPSSRPLSSTEGTKQWRLGAWGATPGYPKTITYHQQRRFYAGSTEQPDTIWGSAIDDYDNFTPGTDDDDAVNYTLAGQRVNAIYWLASSARLRIGTEGGIWSLWGGSEVASLTPTNREADQENFVRCKNVLPAHLGNTTLFLQRNGKVLRELAYSFEVDSLVSPDITILSEDILGDPGDTTNEGGFELAFQLEPIPTIWCAKSDGNLAACTYMREQDVVGWHNHIIGGTGVSVESIATSPISGQDRLWMSVKRTINGSTKRYIEYLDTRYRNKTNREAVFSDSAKVQGGETFATTLTPGDTTGSSITFTASGATFSSSDVGRKIEGNSGKATIIGYTSSTVVTANIQRDFADTTAIAAGSWTLSRSTFTGLDHLEGESVSILADGGVKATGTVSSGSVSLGGQYTDVIIGLAYTQDVETLDIDFGSAVGTAFCARSKVHEAILELFETSGGFVGYDADSLTELVYRDQNVLMGEGPPLFTGVMRPRPKGGWRDSIKTLIRQTDPLPMTLLSIIIRGQVSDQTG